MYWCAAQRNLRQQVFSRLEKDSDTEPPEEHTGRLFTIACKQARLWIWESDYELDLSSPGDSVYNNQSHSTVAGAWARRQHASAAVSDTLTSLARDNDHGSRHPLRFVHPKHRYALAVYFLSCSFLFSKDLVAVLPSSVLLDNGYGFSIALNITSDTGKRDQIQVDTAGDILGSICRMRNAHEILNAVPGTGKTYTSALKKIVASITEIFSIMKIPISDNVVSQIENNLETRVNPTEFQKVPPLTDEMAVVKLPNGDTAIYLSKYFSVTEVLNPNFWTRRSFNELNVAIVGHRSFHADVFIPEAPTVRILRKIKGTAKRGTISTLFPSGKSFVQPSDVFYASKPACVSERLELTTVLLRLKFYAKFFPAGSASDELGILKGQNILEILDHGQSGDNAHTMFFRNSYDANDTTEPTSISNTYYRAYARFFAFLATYERRQELSDALTGYTIAITVDGPSFNNGSGVYPVFRSLAEETPTAYSESTNAQIQYRVLTAYAAIDFSAISEKVQVDITRSSVIMDITSRGELEGYNEQEELSLHSSVATLLTRSAALVPVRNLPMSGLSNITWKREEMPVPLRKVEGRLIIDPFVENRTGRTHEIHVLEYDAKRIYDPLVTPKAIKTVPFSCRAESTLIINAQWPWENDITVVQGRTPEPITYSASLVLSNADYVLDQTKSTTLFFLQARVNASYAERSGFSWIVGRYLGATGYYQTSNVTVESSWFLAIEGRSLSVEDILASVTTGPDQWIPIEDFMPLVAQSRRSPVPTTRVAFVMK